MKEKLIQSILQLLETEQQKGKPNINASPELVKKWANSICVTLGEIEKAGIASPANMLNAMRRSLVVPEDMNLAKPEMFRNVPLPSGLTNDHINKAMDYTVSLIASINRDMRDGVGYPLIHYIQANNFSGIVSNILTDGLDKFSPFKHNHDQRYPDLKTINGIGLEMKAANHAGKGGESHNGHGGWHLIACFKMDEVTGNIQFIHIEIAELIGYLNAPEGDWHYCGSKINDEGSRRTETYYTTNRGTWKLRDGSVYLDTDNVNINRWRRIDGEIPSYSPCSPKDVSSVKTKIK